MLVLKTILRAMPQFSRRSIAVALLEDYENWDIPIGSSGPSLNKMKSYEFGSRSIKQVRKNAIRTLEVQGGFVDFKVIDETPDEILVQVLTIYRAYEFLLRSTQAGPKNVV